MKWVLNWFGLLGSSYQYKYRRFCPAFAALFGPVQKIVFLSGHNFTSFIPIAQQAEQAVVPRRLSLDKCLWMKYWD
jgi:hypothetical protein